MSTDETLSAQDEQSGLRDRKLKMAGYSFMLGDVAMMTADVMRGTKTPVGAIGAGGIWFAGGAAAARYGNPNAERQLEIYSSKLEHYLKGKGVVIPADVRAQSALLKKKSLWHRIENFLYEHPSEMLNAAYGIGAGMLIKQGYDQIQAKTHTKLPFQGGDLAAKLWIGGIIATGALVGLLVKEDPQAREKAKDGNIFQKAFAFVKEKPLRATGTLYLANNAFLAADAWQDIKHARVGGPFHGQTFKPHYFSTLQLATYLFSNILVFMSPRNQIAHKMPVAQSAQIEDAAARIIAAQPPQVQHALLQDISHYMAEQKGIGLPAPQIAQALASRITQLTGERVQQAANEVSWAAREQARAQAVSPQIVL